MSTIPSQTTAHIREIARDELPDDARPDFQPRNRWYVISLENRRQAITDQSEALAERLREQGYKVSVVRNDVKVTRADLHWPTVE